MQYFKIYGERNTGTNYLSELIDLNFEVYQIPGTVPKRIMKLQTVLPGDELVRDIYFQFTFSKNLGWKHMSVKPPNGFRKKKLVNDEVHFITLTKNPYSWLLSLYKRPYHQYYSVTPSFEEFVSSPWKTVYRDNLKRYLDSPVELWNLKNRSYFNLSKEFKALHLRYEDFLEDPERIYRTVLDTFKVQPKGQHFINRVASTKEQNKTFNYYRDYYLNEKWKSKISKKAIALINDRLDKDLVERFGYDII